MHSTSTAGQKGKFQSLGRNDGSGSLMAFLVPRTGKGERGVLHGWILLEMDDRDTHR